MFFRNKHLQYHAKPEKPDPMFAKMYQSQKEYLRLRKPYQSRVWPALSIGDVEG